MHHDGSAPRDGIVVASGYGLRIFVNRGRLVVHDGVGRDRRTRRLSRATGGLDRLVVIGHTGFVTLEALRWIRDVGASFAQIGGDGELIAMSSAERFHNTRLRRAQAKAADSDAGLRVMRHLAAAKLEQQSRPGRSNAASLATQTKRWQRSGRGRTGHQTDAREAQLVRDPPGAARLRVGSRRWYWQTLAGLAVRFDGRWQKSVPAHWHVAGARTSQPSGFKSSRKAATPFRALINYAYAILETEATITLQAHGFDPGMGILHTDKRYRGSLAHDLMEPVRPVVDGLVIDLVRKRPLARGDVYETREGVCRLGPPLCRTLAHWAPALRPPLAEHASRLAKSLVSDAPVRVPRPGRRRSPTVAGKGGKRRAPTRTLQ